MKLCAQNPLQSEFTLCGDAFDINAVDDEIEPFRHAEIGEYVTCKQCLKLIEHIHLHITQRGRIKP